MRAELADAVRRHYRSATGQEKRGILDHEKSAIGVLNASPAPKRRQVRQRPSLYDEAARAALVVLWEASDRVCGKRLRPLLPILLPALERHGHLKLEQNIRSKVLAMSAATMDRLLWAPRNAIRPRKPRRPAPEPRRRIPLRTFADWNTPQPGCVEIDLVAHCGNVNRGSHINSLVLADFANGWTEAAPIIVREGNLVVETLDRVRLGLPFALRALDVDNSTEFANETLIQYCLSHGIELTRSRPIGRTIRRGSNKRTAQSCVTSWAIAALPGSLLPRRSHVYMAPRDCSLTSSRPRSSWHLSIVKGLTSRSATTCNDPRIFCSGVILLGETRERIDGRRDQEMDSAA